MLTNILRRPQVRLTRIAESAGAVIPPLKVPNIVANFYDAEPAVKTRPRPPRRVRSANSRSPSTAVPQRQFDYCPDVRDTHSVRTCL